MELARFAKIQNEKRLLEKEEMAAAETELERQRAEANAELRRQKAEAYAELKRKRAELLRRKTTAEDDCRVTAAEMEASLYRLDDHSTDDVPTICSLEQPATSKVHFSKSQKHEDPFHGFI